MNAVGVILVLICALLVGIARRQIAVLGVFASVCYVTQVQAINIAGFNFFAHRIILLVGFIRILGRGELRRLKLNQMDWALLAYAIVSAVVPIIRLGAWQEQVGNAYNVLLSYFLFRCLVTSWEEVQEFLPKLAILIVPVAVCMVVEFLTGKNAFDVMGVRSAGGWVRGAHYRCIGAFRGPHTAGIFGATLIPLFLNLYFAPRRRGVAVAGLLASTAITITSNSSGPLMAFLSSWVGLAFWPLRKDMRRVRWGIVAALVGLALVMKAPIWYIFAKISDITGGDGWSRSYLMEQCFKHISDWWLLGTDNTAGWASAEMWWGGADLCNLYVSCAAGAGLGGLVLIILLFVRCFRSLGLATRLARSGPSKAEGFLWCLGCALFAHVVTLFSTTYWDQMFVAWWALLAMISSVTSEFLARAPTTGPVKAASEPVFEDLAPAASAGSKCDVRA